MPADVDPAAVADPEEHVRQQEQLNQQFEAIVSSLESDIPTYSGTERGQEDHVCHAGCEHSTTTANETAGNLFDSTDKHDHEHNHGDHGPGCECPAHKATEQADELFSSTKIHDHSHDHKHETHKGEAHHHKHDHEHNHGDHGPGCECPAHKATEQADELFSSTKNHDHEHNHGDHGPGCECPAHKANIVADESFAQQDTLEQTKINQAEIQKQLQDQQERDQTEIDKREKIFQKKDSLENKSDVKTESTEISELPVSQNTDGSSVETKKSNEDDNYSKKEQAVDKKDLATSNYSPTESTEYTYSQQQVGDTIEEFAPGSHEQTSVNNQREENTLTNNNKTTDTQKVSNINGNFSSEEHRTTSSLEDNTIHNLESSAGNEVFTSVEGANIDYINPDIDETDISTDISEMLQLNQLSSEFNTDFTETEFISNNEHYYSENETVVVIDDGKSEATIFDREQTGIEQAKKSTTESSGHDLTIEKSRNISEESPSDIQKVVSKITEKIQKIKAKDQEQTVKIIEQIINPTTMLNKHPRSTEVYLEEETEHVNLITTEQFEELSSLLGIEVTQLSQILRINKQISGQYVLSEESLEVLRGLKKELSMEISYDFLSRNISSSTKSNINQTKFTLRSFGKLIVQIFTKYQVAKS